MQSALAILILSGLGASPTTPAKDADPQDSINSLSLQVMTLTAQNSALTKKNAALQEQVNRLQVQLAIKTTTRQDAKPNSIPDGWAPHKFNGMTYYMIPLEEGQRVTPTTRPTRIK
jgi:uncharacterized small protein (DUF1192 family)